MYVKLGDKDVEYNKNFKLFLHTKLSNPHYPPEVQAETTLINFTVTEKVRFGACTSATCCISSGTVHLQANPVHGGPLRLLAAMHNMCTDHCKCTLLSSIPGKCSCCILLCPDQGLEDQLLALVVNKERPDLEETKTQLIIQNTEFTIKLKQLEDELLYKLSTAEGDITGKVILEPCA